MAELRRDFVSVGVHTNGAESALEHLNLQIDSIIKKGSALSHSLNFNDRSIDEAARSTSQIGRNAEQSATKANRLGKELGDAGRDGKTGMDKTTTSLGNAEKGTDALITKTKTYKKTATSLSSGLANAGKSMATVASKTRGLSLGIGAGLAYGVKQSSALQHSYKVTTNLLVTGGEKQALAVKNVSAMQREGEQYSLKYGIAQNKIAAGYQELVKRGYTSEQSLGSMSSMLKASVASGDDFTDVVHDSTAALESFGMKANSTSGMIHNTKLVTNQMAYAADLTATDFHSMGLALSYSGISAKQAGLSLSETASAVGILSNNGLWKLASRLEITCNKTLLTRCKAKQAIAS